MICTSRAVNAANFRRSSLFPPEGANPERGTTSFPGILAGGVLLRLRGVFTDRILIWDDKARKRSFDTELLIRVSRFFATELFVRKSLLNDLPLSVVVVRS